MGLFSFCWYKTPRLRSFLTKLAIEGSLSYSTYMLYDSSPTFYNILIWLNLTYCLVYYICFFTIFFFFWESTVVTTSLSLLFKSRPENAKRQICSVVASFVTSGAIGCRF